MIAIVKAFTTSSRYGVPQSISPLQTIDIPEQGSGFLIPPELVLSRSLAQNQASITTSDYGVPIAPVAPVRPIATLQTIDLPEQGPGVLVPPQSRDAPQRVTSNSYNSAPIVSNYGVPIAPVAPVRPIAPLQTIDLPEQGPGFLLPPQSRDSGRLGKSNSDYRAPISSIAPVQPIAPVAPISPIETIDLPEQGAGFLESPTSRSKISTTSSNLDNTLPSAPLETNVNYVQNPGIMVSPSGRYGFQSSDYSVPFAPLLPIEPAPITPVAPLETIALPEQGSGFLVTPSSRSGFQPIASTYNDYTITIAPIAPPITPLETIDIPEQGAGFVVPPSNRFNPNLGAATNDPIFKSSSTPLTTILPAAPIAPAAPAAPIAPAESFKQSEILYSYQVQDGSSFRQEMRETNGLTRGFYSYVDPNGILQRVDYISDPLNGYQVLSEPIIKDTPEVAQAKADFFKAYNAALGVHLK